MKNHPYGKPEKNGCVSALFVAILVWIATALAIYLCVKSGRL